MNKGNKNRTILILTIFTIIFTVLGSSLAYLNWQTATNQRTNVVFTATADFSCAADGGGNITSSEKTIAPASCLNTTYAIQRTVTVTPTIKTAGKTIYMDLWLDIIDLGDGLSASQNFMYALTTSGSSCTTSPLASGTFNGLTDNGRVELLSNQAYTSSDPVTYYLYIWLDSEETSTSTMNQPFNLSLGGSCTDKPSIYTDSVLNGADPVVPEGLIPVTLSAKGDVVTTANTSEEWYNYTDKEWANAVLVAEDGTNPRSYYVENASNKVTIEDEDILAYFVWIPKYSYKMNGTEQAISISFNNTPTDYIEHPAFTFGSDELNGIWVGKFETTGTSTLPTILPNIESLRGHYASVGGSDESTETINPSLIPNATNKKHSLTSLAVDSSLTTIKNYFEVSLKFAGGTLSGSTVTFSDSDTYGLKSTSDSHMMKNSEWGAVAYLSHSIYGLGATEVRLNNNSSYTTGCGALEGVTNSTSSCTNAYKSVTTYPQSTTGNVTGIYDMSGGTIEYVMGKYNGGTNTYFSTLPDTKYYDKYTVDSASSCTTVMCGGHALNETSGWYSDSAEFVSSSGSWFLRGGGYSYGTNAGVFYFYGDDGYAYSYHGFRVVLPK